MAGKQHVAAYVRVSTGQQRTDSQEDDLKRWLAAQRDLGPVRWYRDVATGRTMDRPAWQRLEDALRRGQVTALVCWKLDRLGRTVSGLSRLFDLLRERGIRFISTSEGLDLGTPAGRLVAHVISSVAEYETELRGERVRAGQAAARARGKRWGGSGKGRVLKLKPDVLTAIEDGRRRGQGKAALARLLGLSWPTISVACKRLGL